MSKKSLTEESANVNPRELLGVAKEKILSLGFHALIDCPSGSGDPIKSTERLCFAGSGEAEQFINTFTPDVAKIGSGKVYWNRDSGLWLAEFNLEGSPSSMLVKVKMTGDFRSLSEDRSFDKYDMLVECVLFLKNVRSY